MNGACKAVMLGLEHGAGRELRFARGCVPLRAVKAREEAAPVPRGISEALPSVKFRGVAADVRHS